MMSKGEKIVLTAIAASTAVLFGGFVWLMVWTSSFQEIGSEKYVRVHYWSKNFPELRLMIETATWEDDIIDISEYKKIAKMANKLLIRDARGDNDE